MKKITLAFIGLAITLTANAQTNNFPPNGNVGIGNSSIYDKLTVEVNTNKRIGIQEVTRSAISDFISGGTALRFSRPEDGANGLNAIFSYLGVDNNVAIASRGDIVFAAGGASTYDYAPDVMRIKGNGNVGIGTASPGQLLHLHRDVNDVSALEIENPNSGSSAYNRLILQTAGASAFVDLYGPGFAANGAYAPNTMQVGANGTGGVNIAATNSSGALRFYTGGYADGNERLRIDNSGNLGVGTTNTYGYKFAVNGSAIATSMTVKLYSNWPDYVFRKDYQLPKLTDVKTYINAHHHLPEMPTEQQIAKDGLNLGEMNKLLVKKVEELTLYLIEQQKINQSQQAINTSLKKELDELKKDVSTLKLK
ncbi:MAG: hypothetical protein ACHQHN_11840 [Sphingobacteriales bacterium]